MIGAFRRAAGSELYVGGSLLHGCNYSGNEHEEMGAWAPHVDSCRLRTGSAFVHVSVKVSGPVTSMIV